MKNNNYNRTSSNRAKRITKKLKTTIELTKGISSLEKDESKGEFIAYWSFIIKMMSFIGLGGNMPKLLWTAYDISCHIAC